MERRTDYGAEASQYFDGLNATVAPLAQALRALIMSCDSAVSEAIKWGNPVYEKGRMVCAIRCTKDYAALQFFTDGIDLCDPRGLLEGTGKKLRHVKVRSLADIDGPVFSAWIKKAARV